MISGPILDVPPAAPAGIAPPSTLLTDTTLEASGRLTGPSEASGLRPQAPGLALGVTPGLAPGLTLGLTY
jgi:hypothetical protein